MAGPYTTFDLGVTVGAGDIPHNFYGVHFSTGTVGPVPFITSVLLNILVGVSYSTSVSVQGGVGPYTITVDSGSLPPGLTLSGSTLSGTPTTVGSYTFTLKATDSLGFSGMESYTISVDDSYMTPVCQDIYTGIIGIAYSVTVNTGGGVSPYTYAVTLGSLPPGLTLSSAGVISGTPTTAGSYTFTITSTDSVGGTGTETFTIEVDAPATGGGNTSYVG